MSVSVMSDIYTTTDMCCIFYYIHVNSSNQRKKKFKSNIQARLFFKLINCDETYSIYTYEVK